jgi:hypothetical protein
MSLIHMLRLMVSQVIGQDINDIPLLQEEFTVTFRMCKWIKMQMNEEQIRKNKQLFSRSSQNNVN